MFIGKAEKSIEFQSPSMGGTGRKGRPKGAKDKTPRKNSGLGTAGKVAGGLAAAGAVGLAVKNRKGIGGALKRAGKAANEQRSVSGALKGGGLTPVQSMRAGAKGAGASLKQDVTSAAKRAPAATKEAVGKGAFLAGRSVRQAPTKAKNIVSDFRNRKRNR